MQTRAQHHQLVLDHTLPNSQPTVQHGPLKNVKPDQCGQNPGNQPPSIVKPHLAGSRTAYTPLIDLSHDVCHVRLFVTPGLLRGALRGCQTDQKLVPVAGTRKVTHYTSNWYQINQKANYFRVSSIILDTVPYMYNSRSAKTK